MHKNLGEAFLFKLKCFLALYISTSNHMILTLKCERMSILKTLLKNEFAFPQR